MLVGTEQCKRPVIGAPSEDGRNLDDGRALLEIPRRLRSVKTIRDQTRCNHRTYSLVIRERSENGLPVEGAGLQNASCVFSSGKPRPPSAQPNLLSTP